MKTEEIIREFISRNLTIRDDDMDINYEDDIFKLGFVNSLFAMKLLTFIESVFNLKVENHEMDIVNFNSISHMVEFITKKQKNT